MPAPTTRIALLLFTSGFCALVYQVTWLRQLRLVFGASTAASAAVLAIFMAGLGAGSLVLGRRAEEKARPLVFYAWLEAGIALTAALVPLLLAAVHAVYVALGGTLGLGLLPGTALRLLLAAVVLGPPTFLMGGTLPAVARAVGRSADRGRRAVAALYGANTLGAVAGALVTTFFALEHLGLRKTLWAAASLNLLVALAAWLLGRRAAAQERDEGGAEPAAGSVAPAGFVLAAAAAVGFAFLLLELVWYRMLAPILGGSSYTFGLILAVALLGVGLGGLLYAAGAESRRPTLLSFAATCAVEALCVAVPYALGDQIAVLAMLLRGAGAVHFGLLAGTWFVVTALVVLPAAIVAGYQFPLLIALLGSGKKRLAHQVGQAYALNTAGAILGSLAGGFGLLPYLSAPGAWKLAAVLLLALAAVAAARELAAGTAARRAAAPVTAGLVAALLLMAAGPSAVWRHTPTGAGGMPSSFDGPNDVRRMMRTTRRAILWEKDGRESSVAVHGLDEFVFLLNGKADGSARRDAPTQVMSGLIGAALHPDPRRALVIGLGTGSSAGWLAEVESIERVDVVELEPAIVHVARLCAPVNHDALSHPKVRLISGDARELMLTSAASYDVIFSEPSNPYRAGIASLFTSEFYAAAAARLGDDGLFLQWLQGYHVDSQVVRTVYATLGSVFASVESWQVHDGDLLLVASRRPPEHDLARLRRRVAREPWKSALAQVLGVTGVEGFYTGYVAAPELAAAVGRAEAGRWNTDDHPIIEFGFARGAGRDLEFTVERLATLARQRGESLPATRGGTLDGQRLAEARSARNAHWGLPAPYARTGDAAFDRRVAARNAWLRGDLAAVLAHWSAQRQEPSFPVDRLLVAEALAEAGDERAVDRADELARRGRPVEAAAVLGRYHHRRGDDGEAVRHLAAAFRLAREHAWTHRATLARALDLAAALARRTPARELVLALAEPFAVHLLDEARQRTRLEIVQSVDFPGLCAAALEPFEPHAPWEEGFLTLRRRCYDETSDPLRAAARRDLATFLAAAPARFDRPPLSE